MVTKTMLEHCSTMFSV